MTTPTETFVVEVTAKGVLADLAHLSIYNGTFTRVAKGYGRLSATLPKGIYTIRLESNEDAINKPIVVDKNLSVSMVVPAGASSIPISGYASTHDYYTSPCTTWSRQATFNKTNGAGGLFILFRYPDKASWELSERQSLGQNFFLLDGNHKVICPLAGPSVKEDLQHGCLAFSAQLEPGMYYLQYLDSPARETPVFVYHGWQTQLFMTFVDVPLFQTVCISISAMGSGFNSGDFNLSLIDGITQKFRNGIFFVPQNVLQMLAADKWENPMLGIIAAFICLKEEDTKNDGLLRAIISNIEARIFVNSPPSPDVKVLKVLSALRFKETIDLVSVERPCMFRPALKELIQLSSQYPEVLAESSFLESIETLFYGDSIWTSYLPIYRALAERKGPVVIGVKGAELSKRKYSPKRVTQEPVANKLHQIIRDFLESGRALKSLDIAEVAETLNVSPKTAAAALEKILADKDIAPDKKEKLVQLGKTILTKSLPDKFELFKNYKKE